jgi:hypothetical protein
MGARARKSLLERGGADVGRRILAASPSSRSRRRRPNEVGAQALGPSALLRRARDRGHHFFKIRRRPTPASRPLLLLLRPPLSSPPSPKSPRAAAALYSPLLSTELPTPVPCGAADEPTRTLRPGGRRWPRATPLPASSVSEREEGEKVLATGARSLYRRTRVEKVSRRRGAKVVVGSPTSARTRAMCSPVWPSGGGGGAGWQGREDARAYGTALHARHPRKSFCSPNSRLRSSKPRSRIGRCPGRGQSRSSSARVRITKELRREIRNGEQLWHVQQRAHRHPRPYDLCRILPGTTGTPGPQDRLGDSNATLLSYVYDPKATNLRDISCCCCCSAHPIVATITFS